MKLFWRFQALSGTGKLFIIIIIYIWECCGGYCGLTRKSISRDPQRGWDLVASFVYGTESKERLHHVDLIATWGPQQTVWAPNDDETNSVLPLPCDIGKPGELCWYYIINKSASLKCFFLSSHGRAVSHWQQYLEKWWTLIWKIYFWLNWQFANWIFLHFAVILIGK